MHPPMIHCCLFRGRGDLSYLVSKSHIVLWEDAALGYNIVDILSRVYS